MFLSHPLVGKLSGVNPLPTKGIKERGWRSGGGEKVTGFIITTLFSLAA